jgi:hypothetical protein
MVPPDEKRFKIDKLHDDLLQKSNYLQPMQVLGGHCIAEFILNQDGLTGIIESNVNLRKPSLIDILFEGMAIKDELYSELDTYTSFMAQPVEIMNDFCMRNTIQSCIDYDNPKVMAG